MGFFSSIKSFFTGKSEEGQPEAESAYFSTRSGFSAQKKIVVERQRVPVLQTMPAYAAAAGGVQGLDWYAKQLGQDEDGDVASEFLEEVSVDKREGRADDDVASGKGPSGLRKTFKRRYIAAHEGPGALDDPTRFSLDQGNVYFK
eukprot:scaffold168_cov410-Prasinococcus_capsulatus_cf.AAC.5